MADKVLENNQVSIVGEIVSDFSYSHEVYGEGFFCGGSSREPSEQLCRLHSTHGI